ncbi:TPA: restriction endonuclease subunit S [Vibrio vulnificus]|nr:restriction endonuclease subunit S [Vibrio vulnificus]
MMISPEFKRFPNEWKVLPFLEVFEDVTSKGKKVKKENYQITGDIPVVDQGQKFFGGYTDEANKITGVDLPAIVFGDHTKAFKYVEVDFAIGADGVKLLNPKIDADKKFLFYYLKQLKLEDAGYSRHFKFLKETYIPLPPLETQKKIAAVLERADQLRKDCQQMEQELNSLAQSVFIDMFGDPVTNPKGWEILTIGDLLLSANYGTSEKASTEKKKYPVLRMNNITYEGNWDFSSLKYMDMSEDDEDKYLVESGDILFNRTNSKELVGKTAVYREATPMAYAGYLVRARCNELAHPEYISSFMNSRFTKKTLQSMCKSIVGMANINAKEFQKISVAKPPIELQQEFARRVEAIRAEVEATKQQGYEYDHLFNSLMQKAFKGELTL